MRRKLATIVQWLAIAGGVPLLCILIARLLLAYQIHRASQMLAEVQLVKVGDSEDSIRPVLNRFGGFRWDTQLGALEDYNYVVEINPWGFPTLANQKLGARESPIAIGVNAILRRFSSFRYWMVESEIAIKDKRVVAVQANMFVEGKTMWLGTAWRLSEKPREFKRDPAAEYLEWPPKPDFDFVSAGILDMGTGGGTSWDFWVKPSSPAVQRQVANHWNLKCLNSLHGCDSLCELLPDSTRFFGAHRELALKGGGWDEDSGRCEHNREGGYR